MVRLLRELTQNAILFTCSRERVQVNEPSILTWSDGISFMERRRSDGEKSESYSYISGYNSDNFNTCVSFKIDKVPRVRRIFILRKENPERVWDDIQEMKNMLVRGFGQWDELMT